MKAQVINNQIVSVGEIIGTPQQGIYDLVGEVSFEHEHTFEIIDDTLHITGIKPTVKSIIQSGDFKDYKQKRSAIKKQVQEIGVENLNAEDKKLAAEYFALSDQEIKGTLTSLSERLAAATIFDQESVASRNARYNAAKVLLYNVLSQADGVKVIGAMMQFNFETLYVKLGQEGTQSINYKGEADSPGLYDFIQSTPEGIATFGYGLAELGLTPLEGYTVASLVEQVMAILETGTY
jgi:hypothetical protein